MTNFVEFYLKIMSIIFSLNNFTKSDQISLCVLYHTARGIPTTNSKITIEKCQVKKSLILIKSLKSIKVLIFNLNDKEGLVTKQYTPSIRDRVHRNENFVEIIPVFSTFFNFFQLFQKKKKL